MRRKFTENYAEYVFWNLTLACRNSRWRPSVLSSQLRLSQRITGSYPALPIPVIYYPVIYYPCRDQRNTQLTLYLVSNKTIITHVSLLNVKPERTRFFSCSEVEILKFELIFVVTKVV